MGFAVGLSGNVGRACRMTRLERAASDLALAEDALAKARQRATDEVERWYAAMMAQRRREYQDALQAAGNAP